MQNSNKYSDMYVEQSVIGAIVLADGNTELQDSAMDSIECLGADDFTNASHRTIFSAIKRLHISGSRIDLLTLSSELEHSGEIEITGGFGYLAEITKNTPSGRNLAAYTSKLKDLSLGRKTQSVLHSALNKLQDPGVSPW